MLTRATKFALVCFVSWLHFSIDPSVRTPRATPTSSWAHLNWKTWNWNNSPHFCKFVTLKRDLHGPLADARWRSCSFQTLHSRYQMLVWKLVCKSEVVRTNSHLASSLYLFRSWNFELLTDFNNSQRLRRMDSGTCKMRAETAELRKNLYQKIYIICIHFFNKYTWWQHSLY